ncbi:MAG: hypothetical protein HY898_29530 [Deltaproteobacteria bacterium]|nr:hypothetical protein [Deltaproteobacteria bacterium]
MKTWPLVFLLACQPGLGHPIAANDIAHAFTQRDQKTIAALSTQSFRHAVWDRVQPEEFEEISALLAHGIQADVIDTQFQDNHSMIKIRVQNSRQQYRLHALYQAPDWYVDDVLKEVAPLQYISMRRQAEAVLAVRDFRRGLAAGDPASICAASSDALCADTFRRADPPVLQQLRPFLSSIESSTEGPVGEVFDSTAGGVAARVKGKEGETTFYFSSSRGRLVVDDVSRKAWGKTLHVLLREAASRGSWQAP